MTLPFFDMFDLLCCKLVFQFCLWVKISLINWGLWGCLNMKSVNYVIVQFKIQRYFVAKAMPFFISCFGSQS